MGKRTDGRTGNVLKNAFWAFGAQIMIALFGFINRKVFLMHLGVELLGVNGLFSDVLSILSFADLGIGPIIMFALYQPIAEENTEKIRSLLKFYRNVYNWVIALVVIVGLAFYPFLQQINTDIPLNELRLYYWIFQVNNIIGYICAYRESYVIACQHERELTIITLISSVALSCLQIVIVMLTSNFLLYLLLGVFVTVAKKIITNVYIINKYPETKLRGASDISLDEKKTIFRKTSAMLVHKIGNLAINQTDSLVVSYIGNVVQWGLVSNYLMLKRIIVLIFEKIYGAMMPSMGNLIASEDPSRRDRVFEMYDLANFWFCSFCFVGLSVLSSPFIHMFFGADVLLDDITVFVFCFAFLVDGLRAPVSMMREASGRFEKDKWFTILAAAINLVVSIVCAKCWGIAGVFFGTICSMLVLHVSRIILLFESGKFCYTPRLYFKRLAVYLLLSIGGYLPTMMVVSWIGDWLGVHLGSFLLMLFVVALFPNGLYCFAFRNDNSFLAFKGIATTKVDAFIRSRRKEVKNEE